MDKTFGNRNFIGEVIFLTEEQGGRRTNPHSRYRPHLVFDKDTSEYKTSAQHMFIEKGKVHISLLSGDYVYTVGETFKVYEGQRQVGYGKILEII